MLVNGKYSKGKEKEEMEKEGSQNWRLPGNEYWKSDGCPHGHHCPNIIQGDSQDDVQSVARSVTTLLNVHVHSSPKPRMQSGMTLLGKKRSNGKISHGRLRSTKLLRARKGRRSKSK